MISIQKYKNIKIGFFTYLKKLDKVTKTNELLILFLLFVFLVLFFLLFFCSKRKKRSGGKIILSQPHIDFLEGYRFNPDVSTDNWDLHKLRLEKFRRSQYKGLTFFISSENRIYYLSEEGNKVYC